MVSRDTGEALSREAAAMRSLAKGIRQLQELGLQDLRARYQQLYGEEARSKNLPYLRKKIAFRLQEQMEGGLSATAQARLEEISSNEVTSSAPTSKKQDQNHTAPPSLLAADGPNRDPRLPVPGTTVTREFKGFVHEVQVLEHEFIYRGRAYGSLSAIAKEITGTPWNGFLFFGLITRGGRGGQV